MSSIDKLNHHHNNSRSLSINERHKWGQSMTGNEINNSISIKCQPLLEIHIALVGPSDSGKSSLLYNLCNPLASSDKSFTSQILLPEPNQPQQKYSRDINLNLSGCSSLMDSEIRFHKFIMVSRGLTVRAILWDTPGDTNILGAVSSFCRSAASAYVLVYDSTSEESLKKLEPIWSALTAKINLNGYNSPGNMIRPMAIIGSKNDILQDEADNNNASNLEIVSHETVTNNTIPIISTGGGIIGKRRTSFAIDNHKEPPLIAKAAIWSASHRATHYLANGKNPLGSNGFEAAIVDVLDESLNELTRKKFSIDALLQLRIIPTSLFFGADRGAYVEYRSKLSMLRNLPDCTKVVDWL